MPELGGIASGPGPEIENRGTGTEVLGEAPEPQRDHRAIARVLEEPGRDLVIRPACAIKSLVHVSRGPTAVVSFAYVLESHAISQRWPSRSEKYPEKPPQEVGRAAFVNVAPA